MKEKLFVITLILCITFCENTSWNHKRTSHKSIKLTSKKVTRVMEMSDMKEFKKLLNPMLRVRVAGTPENKEVQQFIKDTMSNYKWHIEEDEFQDNTPFGEKTFTNIIATQNPDAPRKLVIACHHDSKYFEHFEFIGATDSAVPCAMMLDMARTLNKTLWADNDKRVKDISLQFIFFDGEEAFVHWNAHDSIYGARHLAAKMFDETVKVERENTVKRIDTINFFILLDLIGTSTTRFRNYFSDTSSYFEQLQEIEMRLTKEHLEPVDQFSSRRSNKYFTGTLMRGSGIQDDHIPFLDKGVPVLHLISYPFPSVWHNEQDNEKALDYETIDNLNKILRVFVMEYLHMSPDTSKIV